MSLRTFTARVARLESRLPVPPPKPLALFVIEPDDPPEVKAAKLAAAEVAKAEAKKTGAPPPLVVRLLDTRNEI